MTDLSRLAAAVPGLDAIVREIGRGESRGTGLWRRLAGAGFTR